MPAGIGQKFGLQIARQQAVGNDPPRLGFLNSYLHTARCYLPASFPLRSRRRSTVFPSIFLRAMSGSNRDPDPSTMLRVTVRFSNYEAQTRRELTAKS